MWRLTASPLTFCCFFPFDSLSCRRSSVPSRLLVHHPGVVQTAGGRFPSSSGVRARRQFTQTPTYITAMSFSELSEREKTLFSAHRSRGESTKCKRFDQIDLLSRCSAAARTSLSRASVGCAGNLCSLICVIVRGDRMTHQSSIQGR